MSAPVQVVGVGADGWAGLGPAARTAIADARSLLGSPRQLGLVPAEATAADRHAWPSPLRDAYATTLPALADAGGLAVLASGDPMLHGVGATLADRLGPGRLRVHPHVSAFQLACARLGWAAATVELVSAVARPADVVATQLQPGRRLVAYVTGRDGAARLAAALRERAHGASTLVVAERLGAPDERVIRTTAAAFDEDADPLHLVAVEVRPDHAGVPLLPRTPGLPDEAYAHDGQLTKRDVRAITLAALAPVPHALLWDVGAGSGSVGIEWCRAEPTARALGFEPDPVRAARARENARTLGVPDRVEIREGRAPDALAQAPGPDAVFVGGAVSVPRVLDAAWSALAPGGRLVANAVTVESEQAVIAARAAHGGRLVRIQLAHADAVGAFTAMRPALPITQWAVRKP
ncbi:precorrin-6y C5,15-methyltransferase (decarboxylating) subunit CbiE [Conexibacter sp. W3-3-2]|uniref:precorrin-6y C5,15-methyltransferase (decarboxylating) subunit CbiE n=1 Tax=Conexibacter sp. W3-3-2 TaxID=2675227 RepID=UPI0012B94459|nr:precorrin-6y C5,15-methyltransferase (decarboxylating) subunit CbiE [Conexibacter sp. W3-3-2]MTD45749.1 precorrin-6y C5,15-methyltransferase (decarboxylating) subunit CbiE [Conexibacter sp. W3-3-2]